MNEVTTSQSSVPATAPANAAVPFNPFARMQASHVHAGTVAIESERAIAESQAKMLLAQRFPRDEAAAFSRAMAACQRPSLAAAAFYSYPRGGETISGPTIRLAEELARCWGRIEYGIRELSRRDGESEMQAYAIDLENLVWSTKNFAVRHVRDTRSGKKDLIDERDIYELTANMGGRRLRSVILAILPPDLKEAAIDQCRKTIAGDSDVPLADRIKRMVVAFAKIGVSNELLVKRLGHKLDASTPDELADLHGIFTSIKDNVTKVSDWFGENDAGTDGGDQKTGIAGVVQRQAAKKDAAVESKPTTAQAENTDHSAKVDSNSRNTQKKGGSAQAKGSPTQEPPAQDPVGMDDSSESDSSGHQQEDGPVF